MISSRNCTYGLLSNSPDFKPTPDFYLHLLHKRLMGTRVLGITTSLILPATLPKNPPFPTPEHLLSTMRLFAHCASGNETPGAVTLSFANPQTYPITLDLSSDSVALIPRDEYHLTVPEDSQKTGLQSLSVALNNKTLTLGKDASLPSLTPVHVTNLSQKMVLQPLSVGFIVLKAAKVPACIAV